MFAIAFVHIMAAFVALRRGLSHFGGLLQVCALTDSGQLSVCLWCSVCSMLASGWACWVWNQVGECVLA